MSNYMMPCEYCGRLCSWPSSIAGYGIPPCCINCRKYPVVNGLIWLLLMGVVCLAGWGVHMLLEGVGR